MRHLIPVLACWSIATHADTQTPQASPQRDNATRTQQIIRDQHPPKKVPATARSMQPFRQIKPRMARRDVMSIVGLPDRQLGSGLFIDFYALSDGSAMILGSGGELVYARHQLKDGRSYDLFTGRKITGITPIR
jgi:hypothetical protein